MRKLARKIGFSRTAPKLPQKSLLHPQIHLQKKRSDIALLFVVIILSLFGLLMVYNSSQVEAFNDLGDRYHFFRQQIIWMILGYTGLAFFSFFDYKKLQIFALPFFILSVILLLMVFIPGLGVSAGGAHRWLRIASITIQPAEIVKLASIIFLAALFQQKLRLGPFVIILTLVSVIVGLFQRDLGSTIVYALILFGMYFVAGAPSIHFLILSAAGILSFIGFVLTSEYRKKRVLAFLDPFADPQGFTYHISQVLIAIGSGGLFGLGLGQSRQKFAYIPEVTTDSIFSIIGEEFGFIGGVILMILLGFIIVRGFKIAEHAADNFGKYLAAGLTLWLGAQAGINLAAMVSLIPLTGVPLPFISYGGSALLANLVAIGILLNISKFSTDKNVK